MAAIPYIGAGQRVTAAKMNELWAEFDRRMTLTMDGKSWLLFQAEPAGAYIEAITGKRFFFTDLTTFGRSVDLGGASPTYDHSVFTGAVTAATEEGTVDHDNKIVTLEGFGAIDLDNSLEAHRKVTTNGDGAPEEYWVWQSGKVMPQRRHRYAVAELIFENAGETSYLVPNSYDKYQYFRVHNLNAFEITVTFEAFAGSTDYDLVIPAFGCRCVQRRPGGQMEAGYNYFWRFKPGDPRSLTVVPFGGNGPAETMRVNNVWNPALVYEIIELFSERSGIGMGDLNAVEDELLISNAVRMIRDPHIIYDISDLHEGYFGDPSDPATLLGDLLHHKGVVHYNYRDTGGGALQRVIGIFNGYGDLASLTDMGLTVNVTGGGVSIQGTLGSEFNDIVTPGSNLLYGDAGEIVTAAEISTARALEHKQPTLSETNFIYSEMYLPVDVELDTSIHTYNDWSIDADGNVSAGSAIGVTINTEAVSSFTPDATGGLVPHSDTVATALLFNTFGRVSLASANQDSAVATLENRRIVLTIFGPIIFWEQKYTWSASALAGTVAPTGIMSPGRPYRRLNGSNKIVEHRYAVWGGYGWPDFPHRQPIEPSGGYNGAHGGVISPRRGRAVNNIAGGQHPNYEQPIFGPDGEDFAVIRDDDRVETGIRLLFTPGYASPSAGHMPVWSAEDMLAEYEAAMETGVDSDYTDIRGTMQSAPASAWMPRVKMLREHYNTMASWVNSCVKARPFCWSDFYHYLPATSESGPGTAGQVLVYDNGIADPHFGTRGLLGTTVRPIGQYCSFEDGSFLHNLFTSLGVPIKTEADLPASFTAALAAACHQRRFRGKYDVVVDTVTNIGPDLWQYKMHREINELEHLSETFGYKIGQHNAAFVFDASPPSWPDTGTPGDDTLVVEYLWVTITDVKAAAEALGLKFIFEELSVPVALEEFTVGESYATLLDQSAYFYSEESTTTPLSTGVYQTRNFGHNLVFDDFFPVGYDSSQMRFLAKTSGSWKRDPQHARSIADIAPADVVTTSIGIGPWFIFHLDDASDEYRKQNGYLRNNAVSYNRELMYQLSASSGYTIASGAIKIPVPWFTHATDDYSLQSGDNARARATLDNAVYPIVEGGSYGAESMQLFAAGSNMISPSAGLSHEVLIWRDTYVDLT